MLREGYSSSLMDPDLTTDSHMSMGSLLMDPHLPMDSHLSMAPHLPMDLHMSSTLFLKLFSSEVVETECCASLTIGGVKSGTKYPPLLSLMNPVEFIILIELGTEAVVDDDLS